MDKSKVGKTDKPHVFRANDCVEIVTPEIFVRCGYPLDLAEVQKEISSKAREALDALLEAVDLTPWHETTQRLRQKIVADLAHEVAKVRRFGGSRRTIYTETRPQYAGKRFLVVSRRVVQTGVYQPASYGGEDYDPARLTDQQSHILLTLVPDWRSRNTLSVDSFEIQAANVKHLPGEAI